MILPPEDGATMEPPNQDGALIATTPAPTDAVRPLKEANGAAAFPAKLPDAEKVPTVIPFPQKFRRRWLVLTLFCFYSATNAFQWVEYTIILNVIMEYFGVSALAVEWTSMAYMLPYILLVWPAAWLLDYKGLRWSALIGSCMTMIGAWIKCGGVAPDRYWTTMLGQCIVGTAQIFVLGLPPRLAAVWFGPSEVATATAVGVFGNQLGIALGFVLPPMLVPYETAADKSNVTDNLSVLCYGVASIATAIFLLIVFVFPAAPPVPPSQAQCVLLYAKQDGGARPSYCRTIRNFLTNRNFVLLIVTYGLNAGAFYAIGTLLNRIILSYMEGEEVNAGRIGLDIIVSGLAGSIFCGFWLDRSRAYKLTTMMVYVLSFAGMLAFTFLLTLRQMWLYFISASILGFFMTGYLPIGFEFGAEITYPLPEGTASALLNASAQIFGITMTISMGRMIDGIHVMAGNLFLCVALTVGVLLTYFIKSDLRRQAAGQIPKSKRTAKANVQEVKQRPSVKHEAEVAHHDGYQKLGGEDG